MKSKLIRIIALIIIVSIIGHFSGVFRNILMRFSPTAYAVGDLTIDWGVPTGDPIFVVTNMLPGDTESREVDITNNGIVTRGVSVRGIKTSETANFSTILDFVISDGGGDLYGGTSPTGPKTLAEFFVDSGVPDGLFLSNLAPSGSTTYTFKASFPSSAGNEFQNASVIFDLQIGITTGGVPAECSHIEFSGPPIFGTSGNDAQIHGTLGNDLIFALEGNDVVIASLGDDCIIGGPGNDELRGEVGNDIIFGNEGDDLVIGAIGNDKLFGGEGNDTIRGENDNDYIEGNAGNDIITGGNGVDEIHGGDGNDNIEAESGNDVVTGDNGDDFIDGGSDNDNIHGNNDNDTMLGQSGNDTLIGDLGTDSADGSFGTDTCDAETEIACEL